VSAGSRYRHLFTPIELGPVRAQNRIVFSAHLTNFAEGGLPSNQHVAYYEARAAGGTGLIITEEHSTHPSDWPYEKLIHGFHPAVIPGYRRITEAVHRHGTPIFAQINHNGGQASGMYSRMPVWSASAVADPLFREVAKSLTPREIAEVVAGYALVAGHCREGGFDGIELQCSHSSIVRAFLSPTTNFRTDRYGGSLHDRARLLREVIAAVREAIGRYMALGVRLCGDELIEGGTTIDEAVELARMVEASGQVDYINISIGVATANLFMIEASMAVPPGYALFISSALRRAVDLPVIGVGRFKDPLQADRALAEGHCDLVGVVRGQIADPDFAAKSRAGTTEEIRLCLSCNQECVGRMGLNRWLGCIENPRTGREAQPLPSPRLPAGQYVLVVGAGPAGLQAAIDAARRGHRVEVYERGPAAGGQVRLAAVVPSRAEFGDMIRNQLTECARYRVRVHYGRELLARDVLALDPDVVVVATGAVPSRPYWAPAEDAEDAAGLPVVSDVRDVLGGSVRPEGRVVVLDEVGFHQATSVAELLADRGCTVEVLTPGMVVGQDLGITLDMEHWWVRATAKGITQTTDCVVMAAEPGGLSVLHHPTGDMRHVAADHVVLAVPQRPDDGLYRDLKAGGGRYELHRVGDCIAPRRAHAAVVDGHRVGAAL
jgi:mycofactocin system FadH/OYE family oxidoreductase 2